MKFSGLSRVCCLIFRHLGNFIFLLLLLVLLNVWSENAAFQSLEIYSCLLYGLLVRTVWPYTGLIVRPCLALDVACALSETKLFCSCGVWCPVLSLSYGSFFFPLSFSLVSNSLQPHGLYSPWNSSDQNPGIGNLSLLEIEPRSPTLQADSLLAEPQGKPC